MVGLCSLLAIYLGPNYGGGNEDSGDLLQKMPCMSCHTHCPRPRSGLHWPTPMLETWTLPDKSGQSLVGSLLLFPGSWCTRSWLCPPRVYFPVLYKLWHLYGAVNGNLLHEGLSHTQVCSTQSPCPFGSPLLTHTSTGDAQTQFCLSLWVPGSGVPGCWCTQGLF